MKPVGYLILVSAIIGETGTILWERGYEILDVMIYVSKSVILTMLMSFCVVFVLSYYLKRFLLGIFGVSVKSMVNWVIESPENHIYFFRTVGQLILNDGWFVFEFSVPLALICIFFELILSSTEKEEIFISPFRLTAKSASHGPLESVISSSFLFNRLRSSPP